MGKVSNSKASSSSLSNVDVGGRAVQPKKKNLKANCLRCPHCDYRTNWSGDMRRHLVLHKIRSNHPCPLCSYSTVRSRNLTQHLNQHHSNNSTEDKSLLNCNICEFSTRDKRSYRVHEKRHEEKSTHRCKICSFSAPRLDVLDEHVKYHHLKRQQILKPTQKNPSVGSSDEEEEEWYNAPGGTRMRYKFCKSCDYKTTNLYSLEQHVNNAHSVSKAEAARDKETRRSHPNVTSNGSENREIARRMKQTSVSSPRKTKNEPATRQGENRRKSRTSSLLNTSLASIASHSSFRQWRGSFSTASPAKIRVKRSLYQCPDCNFSSAYPRDQRSHQVLHEKKSTHQCHLCSYSVRNVSHLKRHLTNHHSAQEMAAGQSGSCQPNMNVEQGQVPRSRTHHDFLVADTNAEKEKSIAAQFSLRDCRVVLVDVGFFGAKKFTEAKKPQPERREHKINELQTRVENLTKKMQLADEEAEEIVNEKNQLKGEIEELEGKKAMLEGDLQTEKSEGNISDLEGQVNEIESELFALRELEKSLSEDLEIAEMSSTGAAEVLCALRLELEGQSP